MIFSWDAVDWNTIMVFGTWSTVIVFGGIYLAVIAKTLKQRLGCIALALAMPVLLSAGAVQQAYGHWKIEISGVYAQADYRQVEEGHLGILGGPIAVTMTIIHFADGRTYELYRVSSIPFPTGTCIAILTKNEKHKIERCK